MKHSTFIGTSIKLKTDFTGFYLMNLPSYKGKFFGQSSPGYNSVNVKLSQANEEQ